MLLEASLGWLELDYADWNDLQIDAMVLGFISPDAEIPKSAVIDFLIAISVLPLATFTSISVLGGSNGVPDWMLEPEERLENLQMESLEAPKSEADNDLVTSLTNGGDSLDNMESGEESSPGGMIDLPFELFGRDGED